MGGQGSISPGQVSTPQDLRACRALMMRKPGVEGASRLLLLCQQGWLLPAPRRVSGEAVPLPLTVPSTIQKAKIHHPSFPPGLEGDPGRLEDEDGFSEPKQSIPGPGLCLIHLHLHLPGTAGQRL